MADWLVDLILCFSFFMFVFIAPWLVFEVWRMCSPPLSKAWSTIKRWRHRGDRAQPTLFDNNDNNQEETRNTWQNDDRMRAWSLAQS